MRTKKVKEIKETKTKTNEETTRLNKINDILFDELSRLNGLNYGSENFDNEIKRSNAMSKNAQTMMNVVKTNIQIIETATKTAKDVSKLHKELGLKDE